MDKPKVDLRIKKTQRALVSAMLMSLERESFDKITVNDLCTQAMVSRSAFYSHFEDKYALLNFTIEMLKQSMFEEHPAERMEDRIYHILETVEENVVVFRNLTMGKPDMELMEMMRHSFHKDFELLIADLDKDKYDLPGPAEIISAYYASGISTAILLWVAKDMPYSKEEMTRCLTGLLPAPFFEMPFKSS